jgi:tetratricopeptide (TPR) repeat protein
MGDLLKKMGRLDEAIPHYAKAVELEPHYTVARKNLGDALTARGRFAEAVPSYQEVAKQLPQAPQSHLLLARTYLAAGDQAGAIREYREVLQINPQSLEALGKLAWLLASADDPKLRNGKEAVTLAEQLCDLTQNKNISAFATLAEACAEDGRFADAVAASLSAIELAKNEGNTKVAEALEKTMRGYQEGRRVKMTKPE